VSEITCGCDLAPGFVSHVDWGIVLLEMQGFEESPVVLRKEVELWASYRSSWDGWVCRRGWAGIKPRRKPCWTACMRSQQTLRAPTCFAWTLLRLGAVNDAFMWMSRALEASDRMMAPIKSYSFLDLFRADPRFAALLRKVNLEA
jgi:hypothetical protein